MIALIVRSILNAALLYFIYGETGGVTTFAIFTLMFNLELTTYAMRLEE